MSNVILTTKIKQRGAKYLLKSFHNLIIDNEIIKDFKRCLISMAIEEHVIKSETKNLI